MNFDLSPRAWRMINRGVPGHKPYLMRIPRKFTPMTIAEIEQYFSAEGCPLSHPAIEFHRQLGGSEYFIRPWSRELFYLGLDPVPAVIQIDGMWYCECGKWGNAPFYLYMDELGAISADTEPLAASIRTFIECDALKDGLMDISPSWLRMRFMLPRALSPLLRSRLADADLNLVAEASDYLCSWSANQTSAVSESLFINYQRDTLYLLA